MSAERQANGYEPRFDIDYQFGSQGEMFVTDVVRSIQTDRIEVKRDARWADTGNLYVEFECRRRDGWNPSGIATTRAEFWAFVVGDPEMVLVVPTATLRDATNGCSVASETDGSHPTKGYLLSTSRLLAILKRRLPRAG